MTDILKASAFYSFTNLYLIGAHDGRNGTTCSEMGIIIPEKGANLRENDTNLSGIGSNNDEKAPISVKMASFPVKLLLKFKLIN